MARPTWLNVYLQFLVLWLTCGFDYFGKNVLVQCCTCLAPAEPVYCNTDFFILVQITGKHSNDNMDTTRYRFKLLNNIRDPKDQLKTNKVRNLHTGGTSSLCGVELKVGKRYLIGGFVNNNRLTLNLCRSYIKQYLPETMSQEEQNKLNTSCQKLFETSNNVARIRML